MSFHGRERDSIARWHAVDPPAVRVHMIDLSGCSRGTGVAPAPRGTAPRAGVEPSWSTPWTLAGVRAMTRQVLASQGVLCRGLEDADVALIDVSDRPSRRSLREIERLRSSPAARVVRVSAAWRGPAQLDSPVDTTVLDRVLAAADLALVGSRGHLVRLAGSQVLDPDRLRLAPAPALLSGRDVARALPASAEPRAVAGCRVLVMGDTVTENLAPLVAALEPALPQGISVDVLRAPSSSEHDVWRAFRGARVERLEIRAASSAALCSALGRADVVAVVAGSPWGDRSLIDTCAFLGREVVASSDACVIEGPLAPGVDAIGSEPSVDSWIEALSRWYAGSSERAAPRPRRVEARPDARPAVSYVEFGRRLVASLDEALSRTLDARAPARERARPGAA